jgi:hypothetical protein
MWQPQREEEVVRHQGLAGRQIKLVEAEVGLEVVVELEMHRHQLCILAMLIAMLLERNTMRVLLQLHQLEVEVVLVVEEKVILRAVDFQHVQLLFQYSRIGKWNRLTT